MDPVFWPISVCGEMYVWYERDLGALDLRLSLKGKCAFNPGLAHAGRGRGAERRAGGVAVSF